MKLIMRAWRLSKEVNWPLKLAIATFSTSLLFSLYVYQPGRLEPNLELSLIDSSDHQDPQVYSDAPIPSSTASMIGVPFSSDGLPPSISVDIQNSSPPAVAPSPKDEMSRKGIKDGRCDLFIGDWVPNPSGPIYTNTSCSLIEGHQNCLSNRRPDLGYLYWRWAPHGCELPPFDAHKFLKLMENKKWAMIGDSISRNHVQSLLCMLSKEEQAIEIYHDKEYQSKTWYFPAHNFTLLNVWSPFLVKAAIFEDYNGVSTSEVELHLDKLDDTWRNTYQDLDYAIFSTGKWFLKAAIYYENATVVGCHLCSGKNTTELGFAFAYEKALRRVLSFVVSSKPRGSIFFRTSTPDHFENGEWYDGGTCTRTAPSREGEIELKEVVKILRNIELAEFARSSPAASLNGVDFILLDFTNLLLLRPDGHPGPYRQFNPSSTDKNAKVQNDCLHWCLPGPIDYLNDVIMEVVVKG